MVEGEGCFAPMTSHEIFDLPSVGILLCSAQFPGLL